MGSSRETLLSDDLLQKVAADETFDNTWPFRARFTSAARFPHALR